MCCNRNKYNNKQRITSPLLMCMLGLVLITPAAFAASNNVFQLDKTLTSQTLMDAAALMRKSDFNTAYQLLEPLESANAGSLEYDYLFGVAAVESNNLTRGAFALERVLAEKPNHLDARAEMAKAHFLLGELETSKAEFKNVLQENPDEKTKSSIEKLLAAIEKVEGTSTSFSAYLDAGIGWDSNVSSAPNLQSIGVPAFGGLVVQLDTSSLEKADTFMNLAAGVSFRHPITKQLGAFGGIGVNGHINSDQTAFDNDTLDLNLGLQYVQNQHNFSVGLQDNHFYLDSARFRHAYGASAQWLYNVDAFNQAGVYGQFSRLDYAGNSITNADRKIIGINAAHAFQVDYKPVMYGSIYGGREDARETQMNFLSQDVLGLRAGGQLSFSDQWQLSALMSVEQRNNDENQPFFLKKRQDNQYDASLGLSYVPARDWSIKSQIGYTKNDSNISLYHNDRTVVSVNIRKDFSW